MIFEVSHFGGSKYIGVEVDSPIQGLGNAKYNRFILHADRDMVEDIIGMEEGKCHENLNCGDQKLFYSYFNRGEGDLPYGYAGKNFNTVSEELLS